MGLVGASGIQGKNEEIMCLFNKHASGLANQSFHMSNTIIKLYSLEEISSLFFFPERQNQQLQNLQKEIHFNSPEQFKVTPTHSKS